MADEKQKRMALARLRGFRSHVTGEITEVVVDEFHSILNDLQVATGEYHRDYSIPESAIRARPRGELRMHPTMAPMELLFTATKYCDKQFFKTHLDLLWNHFEKDLVISPLKQPKKPERDCV